MLWTGGIKLPDFIYEVDDLEFAIYREHWLDKVADSYAGQTADEFFEKEMKDTVDTIVADILCKKISIANRSLAELQVMYKALEDYNGTD